MSSGCRLSWLMILLLCCQLHSVFAVGQKCRSLSKSYLLCYNTIPKDLADTVEDVELIGINPKEIHIEKDSFAGKGWSLIKRLKITTLDAPEGWIRLTDDTFSSLYSLRYLRLFMPALDYIGEQTFVGLNNLTEFELYGCKRLSISYLLRILQNKHSMPNLNILNIDHLNYMGKSPVVVSNFDNQFFQALALRNITEFYVRRMAIGTFDLESFLLVCGTLKVFDISRTYFIHIKSTPTPCYSLRRLVLDHMVTQNRWKNLNIENFPPAPIELYNKFYFFKNVVNLSYNNFFTNETIIKNSFFNIRSKMDFNFKAISLQNNLLRHIDLVVKADAVFKKLEKLEMQGNTLEYLNGGFFLSAFSLKMLNISNNRLNVMQIFNSSDFEKMLYHVKSLQVIDLSRNGLTFLPRMMFKTNFNLSHLYLSNNRIEQIALLTRFTLSLIDLQNNSVTHFDKRSRYWFDERFYFNKTDFKFVANIYGNPFQCICKYQTFIQWIAHTPFVENSSQALSCHDHDHDHLTITVQTAKELQEECARARRLRNIVLASSVTFVTIVTITLSTAAVYIRRRRKLRQKRTKEEIKAQIQDNNYQFQYPVFISYSNEDVDLVLEHVYPDMVDHMRRMFNTPRDLVSIGDRHFRPGQTIFEEIDVCLSKSAIVIFVVSHPFCQSNFCKYELEQAYTLNKKIMLLFIEDVEEQNMPPLIGKYFNKYTRINLRRCRDGEINITPKWEIICESILDFLVKL